MPLLLSYIIKFSLSLAVMYLFYQLVLRRLTFYQWNRFYLLGYSLLCFAIPFIHVDRWIGAPEKAEGSIMTIIPALGNYPVMPVPGLPAAAAPVPAGWGLYEWVGIVLSAGVAVMALRLVWLFLSLRRLRRRSVLLADDGRVALYETKEQITPFSFNRSVYFNPVCHTEAELRQIMEHEYVHVRQRHTIDLLAGELLCVLNWYNPFAWLVRYSIRQNLEYIADNKVLERGVDRKEYQYLLLKVLGVAQYRIANNFNFSNLKKRIVMMNKMKSARLHLVRFLFVLPLLGVLLLAFRGAHGQDNNRPGQGYITFAGIVVDIYTRQPVAGAVVRETSSNLVVNTDGRGYYMLRLPVAETAGGVSPKFHFATFKKGYDTSNMGYSPAPGKALSGNMVQIIGLVPQKAEGAGKKPLVFIGGHFNKVESKDEHPREPSYADAAQGYRDYMGELDDFTLLLDQMRNNPQVEKFYTTEDKQKQIVFLKDGGIEKYGYEGTPPVSEMERKYGPMPSFEKVNKNPSVYYYKQWEDIAARLNKSFTASGDAKAVVFPGDSRVLVQTQNNKMEMYDMDYQQDRDKFEALYGKLPGLPAAGRSDAPKTTAGKPVTIAPFNPETDTVLFAVGGPRFERTGLARPRLTDTTPAPAKTTVVIRPTGGSDTVYPGAEPTRRLGDEEPPLYLVDGKEVAGLGGLKAQDIEEIRVLKDDKATMKYGNKAKNGVILITTKKKSPQGGDTMRAKTVL